MHHWYELWDSVGASMVGHFATQDEALRLLRETFVTHGTDSLITLVLIRESNDEASDEPEVVAAGQDLIALVNQGPIPSFGGGSPVTGPSVSVSGNVLVAADAPRFRHTHLDGQASPSGSELVRQ